MCLPLHRLTIDCSARIAIPIAGLIGMAYAIFLLGPTVAFGSSTYWLLPNGNMGGALDMGTALAGYYWFVQDVWRWPLLALPEQNWPEGTNAALFDVVPIVAICGKLLRQAVGEVYNLFPLWVVSTFALNAAALATLVRALGQRSMLAALLAAGLGAMSPIVHFRFGHLGHSAHWVFVFALALYASTKANASVTKATVFGLLALCTLAVSINLYLYVMTAAIASAALLQGGFDGRISKRWAAASVPSVLCAGLVPLWAYGMLADSSARARTAAFGNYSMNLLAPFWPQSSGAFQWTGIYLLTRGSVGATTGQYEGYSYVGLGVILLVVIAIMTQYRAIVPLVRQNYFLVLALAALTFWALSNHIYLGPFLVVSYPLPELFVQTVGSWFRSSGRFFWPVAWMIVSLGIAGALTRRRPLAMLGLVILVLGFQWIDLSVLRSRIAMAIADAPQSVFGSREDANMVEHEIRLRGRVILAPSIYCMADEWSDYNAPQYIAAIEIQLIAARANAMSNSAFVARPDKDCQRERQTSLGQLVGGGVSIVISQPPQFDRTHEANKIFKCRKFRLGMICDEDRG
jgi:hypothetical protein